MDELDEKVELALRESFAAQAFMQMIGARLKGARRGEVEIELPFRNDLVQQTGSLHAGVIAAIADSACGYAAFTLMSEGSGVLSVEFKLNLLAPATGAIFLARARVIRAGRTLTVTAADVFAGDLLVASMLATMIRR
jgi:uncharacterized protein (TIGR00369 family)